MTALLIIYDLNAQGQNYDCITKKIETTFETRWRFQKSAWLVHTAISEYDAANLLLGCLDPNDTLFVTKASEGSAWSGYDQEGTDWINHLASGDWLSNAVAGGSLVRRWRRFQHPLEHRVF